VASSSNHHRAPEELALAFSGPLGQWGRAVDLERARLMDETDPDLQSADAALLVVAVRNVVRLARAVAALRKDPELNAAITVVDGMVPGARSVRVPLDHVDDYAVHRRRFLPSGRQKAGHRVAFERTDARGVVYVGELAFDVDVATNAAQALTEATLNAINRMAAVTSG
jgi:hypothetical protein